jgi:calcineurin-like phosphoesterase family protein/purple acid phosphatase-like protein
MFPFFCLAWLLTFAMPAQGIVLSCPLNEPGPCGPQITFPDTDPTKATIQWWTDVPGDSSVEYGTTTALGLTATLSETASCEVGEAGRCHRVTLADLAPGTRYYYQLLSAGTVVQAVTDTTAFETLRSASDGTRALAFVVIGDWGSNTAASHAVASAIAALDPAPQFMVTVGDNQYEQGAQAEWDTIALPLYASLWQRLPFWLTLGNHDVRCGGGTCTCDACMACWTATSGTCYDDCTCTGPNAEYLTFAMPPGGSAERPETYYSWDSGDAHFVVLNSNAFRTGTDDPAQLAWVDSDLAASPKRWKFVFFHHPPWSCASSTPRDQQIAQRYGPVFEFRGVDVVFNGHVHDYERSIVNPEGTPGGRATYVVTGTGGSEVGDVATDTCSWLAGDCAPHTNPRNGLTTTKCVWDGTFYSYTLVTVTNDLTLTVKQLDTSNTVLDSFTVMKGTSGCAQHAPPRREKR